MGRALVRPAAKRDLVLHFAYLAENSSLAVARRFLAAVRHSFAELARMPHIGAPNKLKKFPRLRMWRVEGFEKYLIFYEPIEGKAEIMRVIHAAQDYHRILSPP